MTARRLMLVTVASLWCVLTCALLLCSAPALAARGHVFEKSFGGKGKGNGQFEAPSGVAVNEATGDVYVVDKGNRRVEWFNSTGSVLEGQFDGSGALEVKGKPLIGTPTPSGQFERPEGIAVDNSCFLHSPRLEGGACEEFDPSNGDVYVVDAGRSVIDKYSAEGQYVDQITGTPEIGSFGTANSVPEGSLNGVGVDSHGRLWIAEEKGFQHIGADEFNNSLVNEFGSFRESKTNGFEAPGFAVDSKDTLYFNIAGEGISELNSRDESLNKGFDNEFSSGIATELSSNDVYVDNVESVRRFDTNGSEIERLGVPGMNGSGVGVSSVAEAVYVADSSAGIVDIFAPEPPSRPTIEEVSLTDVAASSASFSSEINPRGAVTKYRFEYGPSESYGTSVPVPDGSIGSGFQVSRVSMHVQGLQPYTLYHFRVVAENENGTIDGKDQSFTTQPVGTQFALPDSRQWELVSPPNKRGAKFESLVTVGPIQASEEGNAIVYQADVPTEQEPRGYGQQVQVLSKRGAQGWSSLDISTPHSAPIQVFAGSDYQFFSKDLSLGLAEPQGHDATLLSGQASEPTPYIRREALCNTPATAAECYLPLLTNKEGYADVPPGTKFGVGETLRLEGASPDLSHVLLESPVALTSEQPGDGVWVYEWSAGKPAGEELQLVSVLPESEPPPHALGVGPDDEQAAGDTGARHAVSDDGSRIFLMEAAQDNSRRVYLRDTVKKETLRLDMPQPGAPSGGVGFARFQIASPDGSKVFFTDSGQQLTAQSGKIGADLYECEIVEEAGKLACKLTDLTPESNGHSADVRQLVLGAGEDGSYIYFVANGVLGDGAEHGATQGTCSAFPAGPPNHTCNLYEYHGGAVKFIATLSLNDELDWGGEDPVFHNIGQITARVSPDGRYLTFMSDRSLTGYDNRDANSGKPDSEVYLYDAVTGRLGCVSCNPTGARPIGIEVGEFTIFGKKPRVEDVAAVTQGYGGKGGAYGPESWVAANLPPGNQVKPYFSTVYQPRALSDGGRLFFNSIDALVPQDVNGQEDVYEFEPAGTGGCTVASATFRSVSGGCVSLISAGTSPEESGFIDASEGGGDVFFLTASRLTSQDYDTSFDLYDAHECSASVGCVAPLVSPPPCSSGDSCKGAPSPQPSVFGAPSSATFTGAGNVIASSSKPVVTGKSLTRAQKLARSLRVCGKQPRRKRRVCERTARKRYGARIVHRTATVTTKVRG